MAGLNRKIIWVTLLGLITVVMVSFFADMEDTLSAFKAFKTSYLPLILGLTFLNYLLRFVKWHFFLNRIEVEISVKDSFFIFLSGLAMSVTPGKIGELLKSFLIKELKGVPVSRTAPVIFAERLSDGFGLILLSTTGIVMFGFGLEVLPVIALAMLLLVLIIKCPQIHGRLIAVCSKLPLVNKFAGYLQTMMHSAGQLMTWKSLLFTVLISVISWSFECVAFYFVFKGLGYQIHLLAATFTLAFSSVVGAVSMLPGGLGAAEGSIMGLLVKVVGVPASISAAATILIRFSTLWFGVIVGMAALIFNRKLLGFVKKMDTESKEEGALL